uniref:Uncharacterized protein n=1 Tax=Rhizophora mucronata TaxID=61149 RepID=A0A2P2NPH0_RHIMU
MAASMVASGNGSG